MLEPIGPDIWLADGDCVDFHGFAYPTRSIIVRLQNGALWVWSPIALTDALKADVDALGTVAHLVSPNPIHHLFLGHWLAAFPDACLWGPSSTIKKRDDLVFQPPLTGDAPPDWADEIDQVWFNGSVWMDEIVFFHRASRTAILADLSEHFSKAFLKANWSWWQRPIARLWGIVEGKGYAPLEWRLSFTDRKATRAARDAVLAWDPRQVVMAHGEWVRHDGRAFLARAMAWAR